MTVRKQRLDKYYNLAKEKGYRARSAFKLLELNRKFNFLKDAHIAVDLCAAPGGWLQILAQEMHQSRKIIGVDLDPIKPLGGDTITFVGDITTIECRRTLLGLLDGHQVDIFLHDGAPNFGAAKERDIFVQNDLVLSALKLTSEFLRKGGTFVTKIFRSEHFTRITALLNRLFDSVDVTKPLSSRSESAEVFAVCRHFKSPEYIPPEYFNSDVLFNDDDSLSGDFLKITLSSFILSDDLKILERCLKIIPDFDSSLLNPEILEMFKDVKLLSVHECKRLMRLKKDIIKQVRTGQLDVPALNSLKIQNQTEEQPKYEQTKEERIRADLSKLEKKEKQKQLEIPQFDFFEGRVFEDFNSSDGESNVADNLCDDEPEIEVSSCSTSLSMTESELHCAVALKEKGDEFQDETIDRYLVGEDDIALPFEKRPVKSNEPKLERKKMEYLNRKKMRAMRRAKKTMSEVIIEDEEEEAVVHKKVYKNAYKKERTRPRVVFPRKDKGRLVVPRGRGKIKLLDRRMKHDLRIERRRARR